MKISIYDRHNEVILRPARMLSSKSGGAEKQIICSCATEAGHECIKKHVARSKMRRKMGIIHPSAGTGEAKSESEGSYQLTEVKFRKNFIVPPCCNRSRVMTFSGM